jgi:hypothetical protein
VRTPLFLLGLILGLSAAPLARADDLTASQILDKSKRSGALGLVNARADVKLVVDDGKGDVRERRLTASAIQQAGEVRRLVRFEEPADVRGVAFLVIEHDGQPADRLLYLPAQKRVRRVSGRQGSQSFENTDFAYADLDLAGGKADVLSREPDADVEGQRCWVVSAVPADSPYGKVVTFVHQKTSVPLQVLFEDKDGHLLKRLKATRVKQVDGNWYAFESVMETIARGSKTTLTITSLDSHAKLSPDDYTEQALERP